MSNSTVLFVPNVTTTSTEFTSVISTTQSTSLDGASCEQTQCLTCDRRQSPVCSRCREAIVIGSRRCVSRCPRFHRLVHSDTAGYQGLLCREWRFLDAADITADEFGWLLSVLVVTSVLVGVAVGAYLNRRARHWSKSRSEKAQLLYSRSLIESSLRSDYERRELGGRLAQLRPHLPYFVHLASTTRRRYYTTIYSRAVNHTATAKAYRALMFDLGRLVDILQSPLPPPPLPPPPPPSLASPSLRAVAAVRLPTDWRRLLTWAETLVAHSGNSSNSSGSGSSWLSQGTHGAFVPGPMERPVSAHSRVQACGAAATAAAAASDNSQLSAATISLPTTMIRQQQPIAWLTPPTAAPIHQSALERRQLRCGECSALQRRRHLPVDAATRHRWPYTHRSSDSHGRHCKPTSAAAAAATPSRANFARHASTATPDSQTRPTYRDWCSRHLAAQWPTRPCCPHNSLHQLQQQQQQQRQRRRQLQQLNRPLKPSRLLSHPPGNRFPIRGGTRSPVLFDL